MAQSLNSLLSQIAVTLGKDGGRVVRSVNNATNGRNKYSDVLAVAADITWDGVKWTNGTTNGSGNTAFPDIGTADPVASEANWTVV